ncbi:MAG: SpoVG family protein [Phycisphaerae bacterium]
MEVTEARVKLVDIKSERLKAFCTITMDGEFVIRDIKIIEGGTGPFVAMPSRKLAAKCIRCSTKNHLRAKFCNECGTRLPENRIPKDAAGRIKLHADIAHPINPDCRERIQKAVIDAFNKELERSKSPDYVPQHIEDFEDEYGGEKSHEAKSDPQNQ